MDSQIMSTKFYYFDRNWDLQRHLTKDGIEAPEDFNPEKPDTYFLEV